jgi:hypothetical protein
MINKIFNYIKSTPKHIKIITLGTLYCSVRPIYKFKYGINIYENGKYTNYPLLISEKIFIITLSGILTGPLFPCYIIYDLYNIELNNSNRKYKNIDNYNHILDFIF